MAAVGLNRGIQVVAFKIQESMMHGDVVTRLADAINDYTRDQGSWGNYINHDGDGESGDVVYTCQGDIRKAPYEITTEGGKAVTHVDWDNSLNVVPITAYQEEADDDDHYASMEEAFKRERLYTSLPLYERFISKAERDKADAEDFAGKGKSFPILQPGDVQAAVHAMGRAGEKNVGTSTLKSRIIAIAKRKGWTKYLPKAWRGDSASASEARHKPLGSLDNGLLNALKESGILTADQVQSVLAVVASGAQVSVECFRGTLGAIRVVEGASTLEPIILREARADYEIKLIAPGKGSSAFYPKEVLQRDGPKVFKAGTHVYLNHPTSAEEAARPEGDVKNLAGVLASDAVYSESHAKGPGLYARMKVFADHGQMVEEKAAHVGMSIRANGVAESGKQRDGLPILKELTSAESVDVVTRAGAGGMILTEAAKPGTSQEGQDVDMKEVQKLINEGIAAANAPLLERAIRGDAREEAARILVGVTLPEAAKVKIAEAALKAIPKKDGALDVEAFRKIVVAEAKTEGEYLASILGSGQVRGLGSTFGAPPIDEEKIREAEKRARKEEKRLEEAERDVYSDLTGLQLVEKGRAA
jgi:hypothetical protein